MTRSESGGDSHGRPITARAVRQFTQRVGRSNLLQAAWARGAETDVKGQGSVGAACCRGGEGEARGSVDAQGLPRSLIYDWQTGLDCSVPRTTAFVACRQACVTACTHGEGEATHRPAWP